jgi:diguanylate cyclase (GGDEF)-like protein
VDDFKAYNDTHGHGAGDEVLRCVARILRKSARADDLVGRYGGEEFVLLVNSEVEGAHEVAERIRRAVQQECIPELENSLERPTTVSLGLFPSHKTPIAWSALSRWRMQRCTGPRRWVRIRCRCS